MNRVLGRLVRGQARDALRSRWLAVYSIFFLLLADGLLRFSGSDAKAILSLTTVILIAIPFVARGGGDPAQRGALLTLLALGSALTCVFTAIAFCIALRSEDRLRGL